MRGIAKLCLGSKSQENCCQSNKDIGIDKEMDGFQRRINGMELENKRELIVADKS